MTKVAVVKVNSYNYNEVEGGLKEALDLLGGITAFVKPGNRVLIKPNMVDGLTPDKAATTHPEFVRAVICAVREIGATPVVGDSPGVLSCQRAAEKCGILAVCQEENVELLPFKEITELTYPSGKIIKKASVAQDLLTIDKVISLAKMKTHTLMGVTGAVKNLFGVIVGPHKAQYHLRMRKRSDFAAMLVELNEMVKPVLYLVDGIIGMEGDGPRNGKPIGTGIIIAGTNGYAVDLVMADKMGFPAEKMPVSVQALLRGLSPRLTDIEVVGSGKAEQFNYLEPRTLEFLDGRLPSWLVNFGQNQLTARPISTDICTACGRCIRHCPPQAMSVDKGKVQIDYDLCIRCYCCQELCPNDAIRLQDGMLLSLVKRIW